MTTGLGDTQMRTEPVGVRREPLTILRGATVEVDARRVHQAVVAVCLMALTAAVVVLFVAGLEKNAQITLLRTQGVAVEVTISSCLGLMGGTGSNLTGYECRGTFTIGGHSYNDAIPASAPYSPGATLRAVSVPEDPALLSTPRALADQHASWRVFLLPSLLLASLASVVAGLFMRRGKTTRRTQAQTASMPVR